MGNYINSDGLRHLYQKLKSIFVKNDDPRLTDSRNAKDVYAWAKQPNKPAYTKNDVGLGLVDNTPDYQKNVSYANRAGEVSWSNVSGRPNIEGKLDKYYPSTDWGNSLVIDSQGNVQSKKILNYYSAWSGSYIISPYSSGSTISINTSPYPVKTQSYPCATNGIINNMLVGIKFLKLSTYMGHYSNSSHFVVYSLFKESVGSSCCSYSIARHGAGSSSVKTETIIGSSPGLVVLPEFYDSVLSITFNSETDLTCYIQEIFIIA